MEMEKLNLIKAEYESFKKLLENNILNYPTNKISEDCYLVEQSFIKELDNNLNSYNKINITSYYNQKNISSNIIPFNIKEPIIINIYNFDISYNFLF